MIIFGTKGVNFTKEKGEFLCPQCETQRPYKLKKVVKFFTLYFIPIIPLRPMGKFVECTHCQGTPMSQVYRLALFPILEACPQNLVIIQAGNYNCQPKINTTNNR